MEMDIVYVKDKKVLMKDQHLSCFASWLKRTPP